MKELGELIDGMSEDILRQNWRKSPEDAALLREVHGENVLSVQALGPFRSAVIESLEVVNDGLSSLDVAITRGSDLLISALIAWMPQTHTGPYEWAADGLLHWMIADTMKSYLHAIRCSVDSPPTELLSQIEETREKALLLAYAPLIWPNWPDYVAPVRKTPSEIDAIKLRVRQYYDADREIQSYCTQPFVTVRDDSWTPLRDSLCAARVCAAQARLIEAHPRASEVADECETLRRMSEEIWLLPCAWWEELALRGLAMFRAMWRIEGVLHREPDMGAKLCSENNHALAHLAAAVFMEQRSAK